MNEAHHWGWILLCFVIVGLTAYYIFTLNRPDTYKSGAVHQEMRQTDWPLSIHLFEGSCAHMSPDGKFLKTEGVPKK